MKKFILTEITSFKCAFIGLSQLTKERHFVLHLFFALTAICLGFLLKISPVEWLAIIIAIALVLIAEAVNTIIEKTVDYISLKQNQQAKTIKDMGAAMVLIAAFTSITIGFLVFVF